MTRMLVFLCAAALALGAAAVASAAQPTITDKIVPLHSLGPDPFVSGECGFDVELSNEARIRTLEYSDGSTLSLHHERYFWQANGRTIVETDDFSISDPGDGSLTFRGTVFNVHVPGSGPVLVEAGIAVFENGQTVKIAGLHQVLEGPANVDALCAYFAA